MEAGKSYYINIAYWDVYATGSFEFDIKYMGADYKTFSSASPGVFTYEENNITGELGETIAGGIDVVLGQDGYYYEKNQIFVLADDAAMQLRRLGTGRL